jgi:hypothetical protein
MVKVPGRQQIEQRTAMAFFLARNVRERSAPCVDITLFGVPSAFAAFLGLSTV